MNESWLWRSYSRGFEDLVWWWLAFLLQFCINRHSATNKWNWCHVRSGRVALWGRKREQRKRLANLHSPAEQMEHLPSICMRHMAASLSPWPRAMGLWPWDSMEENGPSLSCVGKALFLGWEKWLQYSRLWLSQWRNASRLSNTCLGACSVSKWCMGGGGDMRKCHKDTSVSQADASEKRSAFRDGWKLGKKELFWFFSQGCVGEYKIIATFTCPNVTANILIDIKLFCRFIYLPSSFVWNWTTMQSFSIWCTKNSNGSNSHLIIQLTFILFQGN